MGALDPTDPALDVTAPSDSGGSVGATALPSGTLLAQRYRIDRLIGRGGMGAVYAAHDTLVDRAVAVKLVGGGRSEVERQTLHDELRASLELTHRNIARTYTLEEVDGEPFIVMELISGETLAARIARGRVPLAETLAIIDQLLAALAHAHTHGVVHRDVKPANIMLASDGRVVLMDFGLARIDDSTVLHTTSIKGTPAYMAPETISGRRADARADLYAVGLILFELVTGEPPFKAATVREVFHRHLNEPIADLRASGATRHLAEIVERLTAKDPAERYATAEEVRVALATPPRSRRPRVIAAAVATLALAFGIFIVARGHSAPDAVDHRQRAAALYERAMAASRAGDYNTSASLFTEVMTEYPTPALAYDIALTYERAGKVSQALYYYERYRDLAGGLAGEQRKALEAKIAYLRTRVSPGP